MSERAAPWARMQRVDLGHGMHRAHGQAARVGVNRTARLRVARSEVDCIKRPCGETHEHVTRPLPHRLPYTMRCTTHIHNMCATKHVFAQRPEVQSADPYVDLYAQ